MVQNKLLKIDSIGDESTELLKILDVIINYNTHITECFFSIPCFDGLPNENFEGSFMEFYDRVNKEDELLIMNIDDLKRKISGVHQVFDLLLLIDHKTDQFKKYTIEEENIMYRNIYLTIAYFDGGFWEISSQDNLLIEGLENTLNF
ncbi:hypothetical protein QWZ06_04215 [Chryseobacterium tructae]|uniref:Uncharacterized protein n=1 Tax=Chryseobacterium tructae TaxID=1037380 RepID=A0ABV7XU02_9FLAO|nr:hypothetical protein [Chryseobacterium tructae]MDN3691514.1 hypothetical protein [Chryseobacterium tructae]